MPEVVARYDYVDENERVLFQVERLLPKGFRQRRRADDGEWVYNLDGTRRVLYHLPEVLAAKEAGNWIAVVEGEKDADSLRTKNVTATTAPGGAGKWDPEFTETLRGAKVMLITDNDDTGRRHVLSVACQLDGVAAELKVFEPAPQFKDITEHLDAGLKGKDLIPFDAAALKAARAARRDEGDPDVRLMSMQELMSTPDVAEHDMLLEHLVIRGARLVIGAYTGHGKSTWALQVLRSILRGDDFLGWKGLGNGTRALVIDVEQGRRTVKRRFTEAGLQEYPDQVKLIWTPDGLALDQNRRQVNAIEKILSEGKWDVVIADPLYKLHRGDPKDERKAVDLMRLFDAWREAYGFSLVLPMHCRKPQPGTRFSMHDISGSTAYTHGAEVVVGLQRASNGYTHLFWWKDREGDLGCIDERWGLLFDQERGFRRDPQDLERQPLKDRIRFVLENRPGLTLDELREETEAKQSTLRRVLVDVGAIHDGARLVADRHFSMPPSLFDGVAS